MNEFSGRLIKDLPDNDLIQFFNEAIGVEQNTNYFMRFTSKAAIEDVRHFNQNTEFRWFMMVEGRIPPQGLNWMLGSGWGSTADYNEVLLLTPEIVLSKGIEIDELDSGTINRWYPAVRLSNYAVKATDILSGTNLVQARINSSRLQSKATQIDILRSVVEPVSIQDISRCRRLK